MLATLKLLRLPCKALQHAAAAAAALLCIVQPLLLHELLLLLLLLWLQQLVMCICSSAGSVAACPTGVVLQGLFKVDAPHACRCQLLSCKL
jgi:hypothetical protein